MRLNVAFSYRQQAILLFLLALAPRLYYLVALDKIQDSSHVELEQAAIKWAESGEIADAFGRGTGPTAHVTPLYTLYLGCWHRLLGIGSLEAVAAQRLSSTVAVCLSIALLPLLARRLGFANRAGILAAVLLAVYPFHIFVETYGRQETVYGILMAQGMLLAWLRLREFSWRAPGTVLWLGILTGLAALTSPSVLLLTPCALLYELMANRPCRRQIWRAGAVIAGISVVMLAPWIYRNYVTLGAFIPLRSNLGLELHIGNNPEADGHTFTMSYTRPQDKNAWPHPFSSPREKARLMELGEAAYMSEKMAMAWAWIAENPGKFVALTASRAGRYWFPPLSSWHPKDGAHLARSAAAWCISGFCLIGLALVFGQRDKNRWVILIVLLAPSLIYLVTHVNVRYRYTTVWTMALLAGHAVSSLWALCASARLVGRTGSEATSLQGAEGAWRWRAVTSRQSSPLPSSRAGDFHPGSSESSPSHSRD